MPKRIVAQTVILQREGVAVKPPIGSTYDFTAKEIEQLEKLNPEALQKVVAKDDTQTGGDDTLSLTQAQLDEQVNAAVEKQRAQLEKQIREEVAAEQKAASNGTKTETATKTAKKSGTDEEI